MKTITRAKYLDRIIELNGTPDIKIITGIRRSGKSKLMQAYIAYLKNNFENINIIFIDFMDLAYEEIKEYHALHSYVEEHYQLPFDGADRRPVRPLRRACTASGPGAGYGTGSRSSAPHSCRRTAGPSPLDNY